MTTRKFWFNHLPSDIRDKALANTPSNKLRDIRSSLQDAIDNAFDYESSPEGKEFWQLIARGLYVDARSTHFLSSRKIIHRFHIKSITPLGELAKQIFTLYDTRENGKILSITKYLLSGERKSLPIVKYYKGRFLYRDQYSIRLKSFYLAFQELIPFMGESSSPKEK